MKVFLLFGALVWFLYSSWAPTWGPTLAIWQLILGAFMVLGPSVSKLNRAERRNPYDGY